MNAIKLCLLLALAVSSRAAPVENPSDETDVAHNGCTVDGELFSDSSRLPDGDDPCEVRICVAGEVRTTGLQCIVRDDCPARDVPGRCCPSYDHCTSLGKFPQGEAEPYPADAPVPAGQAQVQKEAEDVNETLEPEEAKQAAAEAFSTAETAVAEPTAEAAETPDSSSLEQATVEESSEEDSDDSDEPVEDISSQEAAMETSDESVEASGQQDEAEVNDDLSDEAIVPVEELSLAADDTFAQFHDAAEVAAENTGTSSEEVATHAVEQLILEASAVADDSEGSGIAADEASPLPEGSGSVFDISEKLQLLEVPAADDSVLDLALGEGSGAAASETRAIAIEASEIAADEDTLAELVFAEGSGAAASAPLTQAEEVAADEADLALVEGSGDVFNAPLALNVEADSLSADGLLDVQSDVDEGSSSGGAEENVVGGSGDAANY